jgi:hypothetical protein
MFWWLERFLWAVRVFRTLLIRQMFGRGRNSVGVDSQCAELTPLPVKAYPLTEAA